MEREILRTCCHCRKKTKKEDLLRIVKTKDNIIVLDEGKKHISGRGCYVCKNEECLSNVIKRKLLNRAFKESIDKSAYLEIENYMRGVSGEQKR